MASELIAHSAFGLMGYWLRAHSGSFRHTKIGARANVYPSLVEERYQYSETMKNNIYCDARKTCLDFIGTLGTDPWWSHSVDGMEQPDSSCSFWCSDRGRCIIDNWRVGLLHFCCCRGKRGQEMETTAARSVALARYGKIYPQESSGIKPFACATASDGR